jgi:hypothetical protein
MRAKTNTSTNSRGYMKTKTQSTSQPYIKVYSQLESHENEREIPLKTGAKRYVHKTIQCIELNTPQGQQ